jgi:hypothetical protein
MKQGNHKSMWVKSSLVPVYLGNVGVAHIKKVCV